MPPAVPILLEPSSAIAPPSPQPPPALAGSNFTEIAAGRQRAKKIRRAANVAAFSGWSMALFAVLTLLGVLFGSIVDLLLGVALGAVAWNELRGGAMVRSYDPRGPRRLAFNQLFLGLLIILYAAWSLLSAILNPGATSYSRSIPDPELARTMDELSGVITYALYGTMIAIGFIVPGLTAWYYASRARLIREFLATTPPWVVSALNAAH